MSGVESGAIKVPVEGVYDLGTVGDMFAALDSRRTAGKLILKVAK